MPLTQQARLCELAGLTEGEQMRYVWEVVRARMGKPIAEASGAAGLIACTVVGYALLVVSHGETAALYRQHRAHRAPCQLRGAPV